MDSENVIWRVPSELTIYEVRDLESAFIQAGGAKGDRVWDLCEVKEADSCGIQWLFSVRSRLRESGFTLTLLNADEDFNDKLRLLGLSFLLSPPVEEVSHV